MAETTSSDLLALAYQALHGTISQREAIRGLDAQELEEFARSLLALRDEQVQDHRWRTKANRTARRLLLSFLTEAQRRELRSTGDMTVAGSEGGLYRLRPSHGEVRRVVRRVHGRGVRAVQRFCFHTLDEEIPPADQTIGHLFLLRADERAFLVAANVAQRYHYLNLNFRRLNARRTDESEDWEEAADIVEARARRMEGEQSLAEAQRRAAAERARALVADGPLVLQDAMDRVLSGRGADVAAPAIRLEPVVVGALR